MSNSRESETKRRLLQDKYSRYAQNGDVAFIDESYESSANARGGKTFYLLSAFVVPFVELSGVRDGITSLVGGNYWHTNEAHRSGEQEKVRELCNYIADGGETERVITTILTPIPEATGGDELAREQSFRGLLTALQQEDVRAAPRLYVFEERHHQHQRARDATTIKTLRREGLLKGSETHFTSPSIESLLWIPDIVAFAQNHRERGISSGYAEVLEECVSLITVNKATPGSRSKRPGAIETIG